MKPQTRPTRRSAGFSLLELIGVLAIISILASILTPPIIQQINLAIARRETAQLTEIAAAFRLAVMRENRIPDETGWIDMVAAEWGRPSEDVRTNDRRTPRVFVIDGALRIGTAEGTLPYLQGTQGSIQPVSPRILILSNLDPAKTIPVSDGVLAAADFAQLWNTPDDATPTGWGGSWAASNAGADLKIQRIDLFPLFHRVILNCSSSPTPYFSFGSGNTVRLTSSGYSAYYLESTVVKLYDPNENLDTQQILERSASLAFENNSWNGRIFQGLPSSDDGITLAHEVFLHSCQGSPDARDAFVSALTLYFSSYADWAAAEFPAGENASYAALQSAASALAGASLNLTGQ